MAILLLNFFPHIGHHTENLTPCGGGMPWNVGSCSPVSTAADGPEGPSLEDEPEGPSPDIEPEGPSASADDEPEGSPPSRS